MKYILLITIVLTLMAMALHSRHKEVKEFNNGKCKCGGKFETFGMDSQGGTGWNCNKCDNSMWTSWVKVRKYI